MEIGSPEHKRLLTKSIVKIAVKTMTIGLVIGLFLMIPSLIRENTFSIGLALAGQAIIAIALIYALSVAFVKYKKTLGKL
ncbi:hypothetical protein [Hydrogenovibrio kuenenii]|uniref:hypothetical protein n=1 Tax=Hydrogenovibrio kuenenii TaxID=63658 RepID=UPI000464E9D6|nr:hypothetical protein [Hydrogenovibrio kuenenii]